MHQSLNYEAQLNICNQIVWEINVTYTKLSSCGFASTYRPNLIASLLLWKILLAFCGTIH